MSKTCKRFLCCQTSRRRDRIDYSPPCSCSQGTTPLLRLLKVINFYLAPPQLQNMYFIPLQYMYIEHWSCRLTVPVRFQVEEIVVFPVDDEINRPYPSHGVDRELPHTLRELFTGFLCHVHPLGYTLCVCVCE